MLWSTLRPEEAEQRIALPRRDRRGAPGRRSSVSRARVSGTSLVKPPDGRPELIPAAGTGPTSAMRDVSEEPNTLER